jgi:rhamnose transport system permease protein
MKIMAPLRSWEGLLLVILLLIVAFNVANSPFYLGVDNIVNLFQLSIEKIIVALTMTLIIITGEIDLSVASVMCLSSCVMARFFELGVPLPWGIAAGMVAGGLAGLFNGFWVA